MPRARFPDRARLVAASLVVPALLSSCASWTALDGRIVPRGLAGRGAAAHLERTIVWVDSLAPAAARRLSAGGREAVLRERGRGLEPAVVAIAAGGTVRIENLDRVWHQAFGASPGGRFETAPARPGATRAVRFDSAGVMGVWCALHMGSSAVVRVLPHAGFVRADRHGRFRLPALPAGTYRVLAWHPDFGQVARRITIAARRRDTLELRFEGGLARRGVPAVGHAALVARAGDRGAARPAARAVRQSALRFEPRPSADS